MQKPNTFTIDDAVAKMKATSAGAERSEWMLDSSWNEGAAKSAIVDFVARVTKEGGPDFVPPAERIATFDNDGTLWCEQPMQVQIYFALDRLQELVTKQP